MHEVVTKLTQRNQVTVPAEVRLKSVKWTLDSVAGSVKPPHDGPQDFDEIIREATEEAAEREIEKLNRR